MFLNKNNLKRLIKSAIQKRLHEASFKPSKIVTDQQSAAEVYALKTILRKAFNLLRSESGILPSMLDSDLAFSIERTIEMPQYRRIADQYFPNMGGFELVELAEDYGMMYAETGEFGSQLRHTGEQEQVQNPNLRQYFPDEKLPSLMEVVLQNNKL